MSSVLARAALSALFLLVVFGPARADEFYATHLILRYFSENGASERAKLRDAHRDYLARNGREIAVFRLLDEDATVIGEGAWMAFESEAEAEAFVDADPYQRAGLYRSVSIAKADLYLLDKWFAIAPGWRGDGVLERAHARYDQAVRRVQREE